MYLSQLSGSFSHIFLKVGLRYICGKLPVFHYFVGDMGRKDVVNAKLLENIFHELVLEFCSIV